MATGTAFGEVHRLDAQHHLPSEAQRATIWGYESYSRVDPSRDASELAVSAAGQALDRAGFAPVDIDLIVLANSHIPEHLLWDVSADVAARLGLHDTRTYLLTQGCASGVGAFELVAGVMATDSSVRTALIIGANCVSEQHVNRFDFNTCLIGDGAAAALVHRNHPSVTWLSSSHITAARYSELFRLRTGGRAQPVPPDGQAEHDESPLTRAHTQLRRNPELVDSLADELHSNLRRVIDKAARSAGVSVDEIDHTLFIHDSSSSLSLVAEALGISAEHLDTSERRIYGHCGAADPIIGLNAKLQGGQLTSGEVVALTATSTGMHWVCCLLRV